MTFLIVKIAIFFILRVLRMKVQLIIINFRRRNFNLMNNYLRLTQRGRFVYSKRLFFNFLHIFFELELCKYLTSVHRLVIFLNSAYFTLRMLPLLSSTNVLNKPQRKNRFHSYLLRNLVNLRLRVRTIHRIFIFFTVQPKIFQKLLQTNRFILNLNNVLLCFRMQFLFVRVKTFQNTLTDVFYMIRRERDRILS